MPNAHTYTRQRTHALDSSKLPRPMHSTIAPRMVLDLRGGWNGGTLKVRVAAHSTQGDHLTLPPTPGLWLNTKTLVLMSGQTPIGTASHPSVYHCDEWVFTFNHHATTALVQRTAQSVAFTNHSAPQPHTAHPTNRSMTFVATNAAGTFTATQTVPTATMDGSTVRPSHYQMAVLDGINDYIDVQGYRF